MAFVDAKKHNEEARIEARCLIWNVLMDYIQNPYDWQIQKEAITIWLDYFGKPEFPTDLFFGHSKFTPTPTPTSEVDLFAEGDK